MDLSFNTFNTFLRPCGQGSKSFIIEEASPWFHTPHHVLDVLPDFIGGLETKQVEVSQQIVVEGEELQVQLGQSQTP